MVATYHVGCFAVVDPPTRDDVAAVRQVIEAYTFPWEWTLRDNVSASGQPVLPIGFTDRSGSSGYYHGLKNELNIDPIADHMGGLERFRHTLAHELGHYIDDTALSADTRVEIHRLMHEGSSQPYDDCPSLPRNYQQPDDRPHPESAAWIGSRVSHQFKPVEAFANLAPLLWCPPFAKAEDRYGYHHFTHRDQIQELVMADAETNPPFSDIEGTTFEDDILWAAREGIAFGDRGKFRPNDPVTRGQMCAFLRRAHENRA